MKRRFLTADGRVLVEWELSPTDLLKPDGSPLHEAGTFHLLDPTAALVVQTFGTKATGIQEHLSTIAYTIEDDALVCYFQDVSWLHEHEPTLSRSVELADLRVLTPEEAPSEPLVRKAIERHEAERRAASAEHRRTEADRLVCFERALPALGPDERIALRWRYDGPDVVVERSTGEELWREPDWPWMGKGLYEQLRRVAEQKYGDRLTGFEVDVPADEYLRFDND